MGRSRAGADREPFGHDDDGAVSVARRGREDVAREPVGAVEDARTVADSHEEGLSGGRAPVLTVVGPVEAERQG